MQNVICVVTPSLNAERYIDHTIASVAQQTGPFTIRYRVQDGGSTDSTLDRLRKWQDRFHSGLFPIQCNGVDFSFVCSPDQNMYEAINEGFNAILPESAALMTWINADDVLVSGAFAAAVAIVAAHPAPCFIGGRHAHCVENGALTYLAEPMAYPRRTLQAGLHDNRLLAVVMQEGTFWPASLWRQVGGLRTKFRLAGDFDLWRRFSAHADFVSVNQVLALHRRHQEQLSADIAEYYGEIDADLALIQGEERAREWRQCREVMWNRELAKTSGYTGTVATWDVLESRWVFDEKLLFPFASMRFLLTARPEGLSTPVRLLPGDGFQSVEGPYPQWDLPTYVCWANAPTCSLELSDPLQGPVEVFLSCRNAGAAIKARFVAGEAMSEPVSIPTTNAHRDFMVRARLRVTEPTRTIYLAMESTEERTTWLLFTNGWVEPDVELPSLPAGADPG